MSGAHSGAITMLSVIKELREKTGLSIKKSKDIINELTKRFIDLQTIHSQMSILAYIIGKESPVDRHLTEKVVLKFLLRDNKEELPKTPREKAELRNTEGLSARKLKELFGGCQ